MRLRCQLLAQRYGVTVDQTSIRSRSLGARSSSRATLEKSESLDGRGEGRKGQHKLPDHVTEEGLVPTYAAEASKAMVGGTSISENYAFAGVHHIFDQHHDAVTAVKFANNDKSLLACSSLDGNLSICQLTPPPATVVYLLKGHTDGVTGFEWSVSNDLLVSCSLDGTVRLWDAASGSCVRIVRDPLGAPVHSCTFQPLNNNMMVTGNSRGLVQVLNISTGIYLKGGSSKITGQVYSLVFESSGRLLWVGDGVGYIVSYLFDLPTGRLTKAKRILVAENSPITCLSARTWVSREARDPSLLVNCAAGVLLLFSITRSDGNLLLKRKFPLKHRSHHLKIRSSFCPIISFRQGACVVTGSEDMCVYFFDVERERKPCLNKLQGHSAPVLDVCFNYDESLLASSDAEGMVIVWKREKRQF
ncbi:WD repeat-containing protein 13-like isoform X2 [Tachypleus tridentatus]